MRATGVALVIMKTFRLSSIRLLQCYVFKITRPSPAARTQLIYIKMNWMTESLHRRSSIVKVNVPLVLAVLWCNFRVLVFHHHHHHHHQDFQLRQSKFLQHFIRVHASSEFSSFYLSQVYLAVCTQALISAGEKKKNKLQQNQHRHEDALSNLDAFSGLKPGDEGPI